MSVKSQKYLPVFATIIPDEIVPAVWWWWEKVIFAVWMLMTLVLTKSYSSNMMSLLAVRHIPQPYQTLRDILDDSSVYIIELANSFSVNYYRVSL